MKKRPVIGNGSKTICFRLHSNFIYCLVCVTCSKLATCSGVSIVILEHVIAGWVISSSNIKTPTDFNHLSISFFVYTLSKNLYTSKRTLRSSIILRFQIGDFTVAVSNYWSLTCSVVVVVVMRILNSGLN